MSSSENSVWLITRKNWNYDEYDAFVVIAATEEEARKTILNDRYIGSLESTPWCDEGPDFIDPDKSTCVKVDVAVGPSVVLGSYNAG